MFDIAWSELVIIGVVALIAIGPKELPGVLRTVGQWVAKMRRLAGEFQSQFNEAMREAEVADLKKQVDDINRSASNFASGFDPINSIKNDVESAVAGNDPATATQSPAAAGESQAAGKDEGAAPALPPLEAPAQAEEAPPHAAEVAPAAPATANASDATRSPTGGAR